MRTKYIPIQKKVFLILPRYCEKCLTKVWFEWVEKYGIYEKCPDCGGDLWDTKTLASKWHHRLHKN
jgi:hypothetical protein